MFRTVAAGAATSTQEQNPIQPQTQPVDDSVARTATKVAVKACATSIAHSKCGDGGAVCVTLAGSVVDKGVDHSFDLLGSVFGKKSDTSSTAQ